MLRLSFILPLALAGVGAVAQDTVQDHLQEDTVARELLPLAGFRYTDSLLTVYFADTSESATSWHWDFGDGSTDTVQHPVHTYASDSTYKVCLIVTNTHGTDTFCDSVTVACNLFPVAGFAYNDLPMTGNFSDASTSATNWRWDFGDGTTSAAQHPAHTYAAPGTYEVCLVAANACGSDSLCDSIQVACNVFRVGGFSYKDLLLTTGTFILKGTYQGKNLLLENTVSGFGEDVCTHKVTINGKVAPRLSSVVEVDLSFLKLEIGDSLEVSIAHTKDCQPNILNPEVLKNKSTYNLVSMSIDTSGVLTWKTSGELGKLPFTVEHLWWNKWVNVGMVQGRGTPGENEYSFKVSEHSGENQLRVKQVDHTGNPRYSKILSYRSSVPEVRFGPEKITYTILFTAETKYEIYDSYGKLLQSGFGFKVNCAALKKGMYHLNYDNKHEEFIKK